MKYLLLALCVCNQAFAEDPFLKFLGDLSKREAYFSQEKQWAEQWPADKSEVTIIHKNQPSSEYAPRPLDLNALAEALKNAQNQKPVEFNDSPFNDSFMPGVE